MEQRQTIGNNKIAEFNKSSKIWSPAWGLMIGWMQWSVEQNEHRHVTQQQVDRNECDFYIHPLKTRYCAVVFSVSPTK